MKWTHPQNIIPGCPLQELIMARPCDHLYYGHDGNGTSMLASREYTLGIVSLLPFLRNYTVIIKYILVWSFIVLLFKYQDSLNAAFAKNLAGKSPGWQMLSFQYVYRYTYLRYDASIEPQNLVFDMYRIPVRIPTVWENVLCVMTFDLDLYLYGRLAMTLQ